MPRLIAWPLMLPAGTYSQLHQLHHRWNGTDLRDPERVQWTESDYQTASCWQRWYVRHQWVIDIFIFGSLGIIFNTLVNGFKLQKSSPQLLRQMIVDGVGIAIVQGAILSILYFQAVSLWQYLLFLVIIERGVGIILQTRDHLEHYGLWRGNLLHGEGQQSVNYQLTQLYACRNIKTYSWVNWLMGGLPYHSIHHAFPYIPNEQLPDAFERIQAVLQKNQLPPMVFESGYMASSFRVGTHPGLIKTEMNSPLSCL